MLKSLKTKSAAVTALVLAAACAPLEEEPEVRIPYEPMVQVDYEEPETTTPVQKVDFNRLKYKVIAAEKTDSSVTYEYHDVRIDEIAQLAGIYCQDHGNRNAYLERILLHKNNYRRAVFYCSSK